jgi:hypothetical protein
MMTALPKAPSTKQAAATHSFRAMRRVRVARARGLGSLTPTATARRLQK